MPIKFRELSRIPVLGYETNKVSALGCHNRRYQTWVKAQAIKGNIVNAVSSVDTHSFTFLRISSYVPVAGSIMGLIHFQEILRDKKIRKMDPTYVKCYHFKPHLFRSIIEMLSLGIIFLPVDILVTLGREIKLSIFCKQSPRRQNVLSKDPSLSDKIVIGENDLARETHELIFSFMEDIDDVKTYAQLSKSHHFHAKKILEKYSKMPQFSLNDYGCFSVLGTLKGAPLAVKDFMMLQEINCPFDINKKIVDTHELRLMPEIEYKDDELNVFLHRLAQNWYKNGVYFSSNLLNIKNIKDFDEAYFVLVPKSMPFASIKLEQLLDLHSKNALDKNCYVPSFKDAFMNLMIMSELQKKPQIELINCSDKTHGRFKLQIESTKEQIQVFC